MYINNYIRLPSIGLHKPYKRFAILSVKFPSKVKVLVSFRVNSTEKHLVLPKPELLRVLCT